jgi:uncharacterized membrane protein (Fun14 family)
VNKIKIIFFLLFPYYLQAQINDGFIYGTPDKREFGNAFFRTSDNGFIILGEQVDTTLTNRDILVFKIDSAGNVLWSKTLGGSETDYAGDIIATNDSNFIIVGGGLFDPQRGYDMALIKINNSGTVLWSVALGTNASDYTGYKIKKTDDGGYIIGGVTNISTGGFNQHGVIYVAKTDTMGFVEWASSYDGGINDYFQDIVPSKNGGYFIVGYSLIASTEPRGLIMKVDEVGNIEWSNILSAPFRSGVNGCLAMGNGNFIISGFNFQDGKFLMEVDTTGQIVRAKGPHIGLTGGPIIHSNDGGFVLPSSGGLEIWILKTDSLFNFAWGRIGEHFPLGLPLHTPVMSLSDTMYAFVSSSDKRNDDILFRYFTETPSACDSIWPLSSITPDTTTTPFSFTVRSGGSNQFITLSEAYAQLDINYMCGNNIISGIETTIENSNYAEVFPVPFSSNINFRVSKNCSLKIYDVYFSLHKEISLKAGETNMDLGLLNSGIYILEFESGNENYFRKIIKVSY